jgi:alkylation response protein AidB-like acyl-CoA dehydrogenase
MDFALTDTQLHWRDVARAFVRDHIAPDVLRRDRLPTAEERIPWDWIREASAQGLRTLGISKAFGGAGVDVRTMCIVGEEIGAGDLGFAVIPYITNKRNASGRARIRTPGVLISRVTRHPVS